MSPFPRLSPPPDATSRAMLAIGGTVGVAALVSPTTLQRLFAVPAEDIRGPGQLGWRLFGARNVYLTWRALGGHPDGLAAYGPLQALDQAVFWDAFARRSVPRVTSSLAIAASGAIVALDVRRRAAARSAD